MKCPKCSYLSFEAGERCRNCGYDFSMATPPADDPAGELPLFDDRPLVSVPASPRQPLSVRRTTQDPARLRQRNAPPAAPQPPPEPELDLTFQEEPEEAIDPDDDDDPEVPARRAAHTAASVPAAAFGAGIAASGVRRLIAAIIDATLIVATDLAVVYLTIRAAGQDWDSFALPIVPIVGFLLILNGGYFVMFTAAAGQTIGKMAADIRVVGAAQEGEMSAPRITFGRAMVRTAAYLASLLPAGLGFLPAFIGPREHRALHDRIAGTRVVRA